MAVDELRSRIAALVGERTGEPVEVTAVAPLAGGACQDLFRVELASGGVARKLVLRSDAVSSLPESLRRRDEYQVIRAAVSAGVPTPAVLWPSEDLVRPGASAYFMDWVDGHTIGRRVLREPALAGARAQLPAQLAAAVARVHSITPAAAPDLPLSREAITHGAAEAVLAAMRRQLDQLVEPRPALELAWRWLDRNRPPRGELTLCHGDFRVGNIAVTERGLNGLLDWEFAHWGDPVDDLGFFCVRDWRFGVVDKPAGGITSRTALLDAYHAASGRRVDPAALHFWELKGNLHWAIGAIYQGERYLSGAESDVELIAIGRRAVELEYEILRLMEKGPGDAAAA
jgi:aminoglycoside phosphotransferase (APT) family kinase protein